MAQVFRYIVTDDCGASLAAWDSDGRPQWGEEDEAIVYRTRKAADLECGAVQSAGLEAKVKRIQ